MEEFLGVLFCGGRGKRLGHVTKFVSKTLLPVYDKPVFEFGLDLLKKSRLITDIVILTNDDNDAVLRRAGYRTIIQDDKRVCDMFSGWNFIKEVTGTKKDAVLYPGDNIVETNVDELIKKFLSADADFLFMLKRINDRGKISQMGSYDLKHRKFFYKKKNASDYYGVIAPYIISNDLKLNNPEDAFESKKSINAIYRGTWFDIGDYESMLKAALWRKRVTGHR